MTLPLLFGGPTVAPGAARAFPPRSAIRLLTLSPDGTQGWDLTDYAGGLGWSNVNPGGDERCGFQLKRKWFSGAPEISQGNRVRVVSGLDVLFQGRIEENDRSIDSAEAVGVTAYGMGVKLKDDESFRQVIVDRDLSQWGEMPLNEKKRLAATYDFGTYGWSNETAGLTCALPNQALSGTQTAEAWYVAPSGVVIATVAYQGKDYGSGFSGSVAASVDDGGSSLETHSPTLDDTVRTISVTTPTRYVFTYVVPSGATTPPVGSARLFSKIAAYGNHGLTLQSVLNDCPGVLGSDVVSYVVGKVPGLTARNIDASAFVIPQLVWRDGVTHEQAIVDASAFDAVDWGTWGPSSPFDSSTGGYFDWTRKDLATQHWYAMRADCDDVALNVELATLYDAVDVVYTDESGVTQVVTRTTTVAALDDAQIDRKATIQGGTLTTAGAQQLGDAYLALTSQQPPARGQVTLTQPITHYRRGKLAPHFMRADGSNIRVPDVLPSEDAFSLSSSPDRRTTFPIRRVSVDAGGQVPKVTVEVDQTPDYLAIVQARLASEVAAVLGTS